ncbi:uncharacterized protein LOC131889939 [Tigriopus californicus]|uniref:uncharacterized protein LOC131889939 n=1 Tax=Tigriopus californicus TaxID=6832 RepID=UPI0027DA8F07|nr:uncharacterized protein LOC131889939 [Tigriopus californicus]
MVNQKVSFIFSLCYLMTNGFPACDFIPDGTIPCSQSEIPLNVSSESAAETWTKWMEVVDREILSKALKKVIKEEQQEPKGLEGLDVKVTGIEVDDEAFCRISTASFKVPDPSVGLIDIDSTTDLIDNDGDLSLRVTVFNCNEVLTSGNKELFAFFFPVLQKFMAVALEMATCVFSNEDYEQCFALVE